MSFDGFDLSCPASANEGATVACTLTNTGDEAKDWPVVGILHLSSDANRALVRGSPLDLQLETPAPASGIGGGLWWIGDVLMAYSRFDWGGEASAQASRTVSIIIENDDDYEGEEIFYVSLAPHRSRGVGFLYTNRQAITISASDTKSSDADLSDLKIAETDAQDTDSILSGFSSATTSYTVTVAYRATEAIVTPTANHKRATITVDGESVESGKGSPAIPLGVGSTAIEVVVTAENGDAKTYQINVTRQPRAETVEVKADGFTLVCPSSIAEGSNISCALTNTNSTSEDWPVVAIIHSSSDGDSRALLAEDTRIPESNPSFGIDVRLSDVQTPARENYNYGYGELFSGGSRSVYTTYGYQKFDWSGQGAASATRSVVIQTMADDEVESAEIFYIAVAPSGHTDLSRLVDNKAPIIIERKDTPDTTPPTVNKIAITSDPGSDLIYAPDDEIEATVTFSEAVLVTGTPQLTLKVGGGDRTADYQGGTGTAALVFAYEVADGDEDTDGVNIEAGRIALNGGSIKDEADNDAVLDHEAVAPQAVHEVDGVRPAFLSAAVDGSSLTLSYGETLDGGSRPASGDYTVEVDGAGRNVTGIFMSDTVVTLTLASAVAHGEAVTVSYSPGTNPIQDAVGNDALGLNNEPVTNETPETALPNMWLNPTESDPVASVRSEATYSVTFQGSWSTTVTTDGLPSGAHFTTLIGGVHNAGVTFLREGGMASAGVESMAEVGGTSTLKSEINAAMPNALAVIEQSIASGGTATATVDITLTTDHPRVTLLSMVAPSPDWFVGVSGLSLLDEQGDWLASRTVNLYPWDAGTEEGTEFSLSNPATSPQGTITSLRGMGKFSNEAIATLTFTRQSVNTAPSFTSATSFEVDENQTAAGTVVAEDPDSGDEVAYTITGGADASEFEIGETTGVLTFPRPPNYESPADVASMDPLNDAENNEHVVTVTATGGTADRALTAKQTITVTVRNVEEAGTVSFSQVGAAIRAKLSDPDGGVNGASWQWARSLDRSTGWVNISSATSAVYTPSSDDQEKYLRATVSYDDGHGSGKQAQGVSTYEITPPKLLVSTLVSGLTIPWDLAFTPDGTMLFTERSGVLSSRLTDGTVQTVTAEFGDVFSSGENGLMGIVVDPDFSSNRRFCTCQAHTGPEIQVIAWTINAAYTTATRVADPLVGGMPASSFRHGGCRLRFGPQGYLWIATGDAASGTVPQDLTLLGGKVLRVDASTGAGAPANPFASSPLIYTYGHRNPQGLALRPGTSQMWSIEHGPSVDDEINLLVAGRNYGWDPVPGYNESVSMTDLMKFPGAVEAKWSSGSPTLATSGGIFLEGEQWGVWEGRLAVATLRDSNLRLFEFTPDGAFVSQVVVPELDGDFGRLRTPMMGPDGALYVTTSNGGGVDRILRIVKDEAVPVRLKLTPEAIAENGGFSTVTVSLDRESNVVTTVMVSAEAVAPSVAGDFTLSTNKTLTIAEGETSSTGEVTVRAVDNNVDALDKTVTVSATAENINGVTQPSAVTLTIIDDDAKPVITTASPILVAENATEVATLAATDADGVGEHLEWELAGGADRSKFTLTSGGDLSFKGAKDYESPDDANRDGDYEVTVRVSDGANPVVADFIVRLQDVDDTAPAFSSAVANGATLTLAYDELLDGNSTPEASAFTVTGGNETRTVTQVRVSGSTMELTLDPAVEHGETGIRVSYTVPTGASANPIRDAVGNAAFGLSNRPVMNETPDTTAPRVMSITSETTHPTKDRFTVTIIFTEEVTGLTAVEIVVINALGSNFAGAGASYTLDIEPSANIEDDVTVRVPADAAVDGANIGNLEGSATFAVDTRTPTVSTVEISSDPGTNRTYAAGDEIQATVTFSETVEVEGTPWLELELGGGVRTAIYQGGSGTAALVFAYEVADGESGTDGVGVEADSLSGGTIKDGADNPAVLDHEAVEPQAGHQVDGVKPVLAATDGAVADGATLTLTYNELLDRSSTPASGNFTVSGGDHARTVSRVSVSGSTVVLTLDAGAEHGEAGIQVSYTPGTNPIRDVPGNEAEALSREPVTNDTPDTTAPTVSSLAITSNPGGDQIYAAEDEIEVTVTFDETLEVQGTPQLRLRVGSRNRTAGYLRGSGTAALVFSYEVALGDEDTDGVSIAAGRIDRNGGTIKDEADNDAVLDHEALAPQAGHKVDGVRPAFLSAAVDGSSLTLTYGEALDPGSRPAAGDFTVQVESSGRSVSGVSVSGSVVTLTLDPAVEHGDMGIRVNYSPGTRPIRDAVGNDALGLSSQSVTNTTGAPNTAPEITSPGSFDVPENQELVRRLAARDDDPGDEVTGWEIVGGADRFQFSVARDTGELSFQTAPDFEAPGDNEYEVTVEVRSGTGARELEAEQTFTVRVTDEREPPGIPEAPTFSGETAESMTVNWSEPENTGPPITDYDVQYREGGSGGFTDAQHEGPGFALTLSDLKAGTVYEVQVRARNDEGMSDWSESGEGMTVTPLTVQMTPSPPPPVEAPFTMRFSFSEEVRGFTSGDIESQQEPACTDSGNNPISCNPTIAALQTTDNRIFTTTVTPRTAGVNHNYTLTLTVPAGRVTSAAGNKPNKEAMLEVRVAPPGVTVPISSLGRTASPGNGQVTLSWNTPQNTGGSAIIRYEYRWRESGADFGAWVSVGPAERSATVHNLTNGREYVFEVRGVNALGYGPVETASATPESGGGGGGGGGGGLPQPPRPPANNRPMADAGPDQTGVREGALVTLDGSGSSDPDDDPLKYRWNQYRGERVALSSRDVVNPTFTAPRELTADVVLSFRLLVTDPGGRFDTDTVEVTVTVTDEDNENPGKPLAPTVSAATPYSLMVEWMEPENTGPAITDYDVRYRKGGSGDGFTDAQHQGTARTATLTGLSPDTVYEVQVRATNATGTGDWSEAGEGKTKTLQTGDQIYYFPHLAVGASWQTTITYINYSPEEVTCQTDFLSDHGTPLMVSFAELGTVDSRPDVLPPGGSVHQETDVDLSDPLAPGWALANCSGPVKASLLFRRHNSEGVPTAEAGVNATAVPATRFVTFAEQGEGQFGTGVAYANPSATAALVTFTARDTAGEVLASVDRELLPGGHDAHGMAELFGLTSFTGSIEVTSTEPIVSLSINAEAAPLFSSLPPGELDAAAQGSTTYYFPHLAVGASWQTTITYINYSPQEVTCQTDFISDYGTPLMVSFAALGTVVSRPDVLPPGGSVHQETNVDLNASLARGWARANCSGPVKASLLYRRHNSEGAPTGEAGVNATAVPATRFVTFAEQGEGQFGTGVAYANPSAISVPVTFTARDAAGEVLASVVRTLSPGGHDAHGMAELFGLTSFTGSLEVTSTEPILSLSLNSEAAPVFSSLPPGELEAAAQ